MNGTKQTNNKQQGSKIDPATINKILTMAKKTVKSDIINSQTPKRSALKEIGKSALNVVKEIAPEVAGLIPGVGPIAKMVLSTLNDDEWFNEYSSAGATFSELLALDNRQEPGNSSNVGALGIGAIYQINTIVDLHTDMFDDVFAMVIANIRSKTDNVLVNEPEAYREALSAASKLVAIYFTLRKYLAIAEKPPINIPGLTDEVAIISPQYISQIRGVTDTLEAWLKSTTALPHAWFSYLRWRFGSAFFSDNTGKPGLVLYDYCDASFDELGPQPDYEPFSQMYKNAPFYVKSNLDLAQLAVQSILNMIQTYKAQYIGTSRAGADIKLAYKDHVNDYTVEKPHFDEKEYNLRMNQWAPTNGAGENAEHVIYMDSRLSSSPAIQSVTISTDSDTPFAVSSRIVHFYIQQPVTFEAGLKVNGVVLQNMTYHTGWHSAYVDSVLSFSAALMSEYAGLTPTNITNYSEFINSMKFYASSIKMTNELPYFRTSEIQSNTDVNLIYQRLYDRFYGKLILDSLQGHSNSIYYGLFTESVNDDNDNQYQIRMCNLAYDRATITNTQLKAIQRTALRNLWRADYKMKAPVNKNEELTSSFKELKETVINNA